jgi:DnaJ family protein B protein 12
MEVNKDEALRCLVIAQQHRDSGNISAARKFCQKSINLFPTPEALKLLASVNAAASSSSSSTADQGTSNFTSSTESHPSASGVKHRHVPSSTANGTANGLGGEKRDYTPEQRDIVKRVRSCKITEYYEILGVKRECEEAELKKAYRKVGFSSIARVFIELVFV